MIKLQNLVVFYKATLKGFIKVENNFSLLISTFGKQIFLQNYVIHGSITVIPKWVNKY